MAGLSGSSWQRIDPSTILPGLILPYQQASGFTDLLAGGDPLVQLSEGDKYAYAKVLDVRTQVMAGQSGTNNIPTPSVTFKPISVPTWLMRARAEYDHHDTAMAGKLGFSLVDAFNLAMDQGIFQQLRNIALFGMNPSNGEGILNASGITAVNLPPDSNGNDTLATYDNGELAMYIMSLISALLTRTNQLGLEGDITILGPQRILGPMEWQNIVQLTSAQRPGGGFLTTANTIKVNAGENKVQIKWTYDDTLQGQGSGGADVIIIALPQVKKPANRYNTNEFATLAPGWEACISQLVDKPAPTRIPSPLAGGATDVVSEMLGTSGWVLRPEAVTVLSINP